MGDREIYWQDLGVSAQGEIAYAGSGCVCVCARACVCGCMGVCEVVASEQTRSAEICG